VQSKITKRHILAEIGRIFDPLILDPCNIRAKILLQKLWLHKLTWNEFLLTELHDDCLSCCKQIQHINKIKTSRNVIRSGYTDLQLHEFSDASQSAYRAYIYIRSQLPGEECYVALLCAKNRVTPLITDHSSVRALRSSPTRSPSGQGSAIT